MFACTYDIVQDGSNRPIPKMAARQCGSVSRLVRRGMPGMRMGDGERGRIRKKNVACLKKRAKGRKARIRCPTGCFTRSTLETSSFAQAPSRSYLTLCSLKAVVS